MPMIWWGMWNPTAASKAEMTKMVVEKQMAFAEACVAVQARTVPHDAGPLDARQRRPPDAGGDRPRRHAREGQCAAVAALKDGR